jgi:hypothetical protein
LNKKILVIVVGLIVALMLSSVALVLAAPKEKVDFALYFRGALAGDYEWCHANGYIVASPDKRWDLEQVPPPEGYVVWHYNDAPYVATFVELVVDGTIIPMERLYYTATLSGTRNFVASHSSLIVDETVTIYDEEGNEWGTIEMRAFNHRFFGQGTGALSGVKVQGVAGPVMYGDPPVNTRSRIGTAVGWPTS